MIEIIEPQEEEMELVSEVNGVRLLACDTTMVVAWDGHLSVFFSYPAAEACFCKHVEEVDAR